jgi:hypothetical protein
MPKNSIETTLMAISTPEERLDFMADNFSRQALEELFSAPIKQIPDLGEIWVCRILKLINISVALYVQTRDAEPLASGVEGFRACLDPQKLFALVSDKTQDSALSASIQEYLLSLPGYTTRTKKLSPGVLQLHDNLVVFIEQGLKTVHKHLQGRENLSGQTRSLRQGDVQMEGPGFEVVVGPKHQNIISYPDGKTAIILMHDPRDGHFLLVERFSEIDCMHVLEFPKVAASSLQNREHAAAIALRDLTGLPLRNLELIGEIKPDVHMIAGSCEVYYGTFDLEENLKPNSRLIRDVKRINEEGLYQNAYEKKISCAQTLSAMSIWHAFESVRKKREANSRRVRTPKSGDDAE